MSVSTILLALGGNALLQAGQEPSYANQIANVSKSTQAITRLAAQGLNIAITHGNGPQIGALLRQNEESQNVAPSMPLDVLSGASQGMLGYMLQNSLSNSLEQADIHKQTSCLLTRVLVDAQDPAFSNPTKPVGFFYDEPTARQLAHEKGWTITHDPLKGWRRVIASPKPISIVEKDMIRSSVRSGFITISCGGGGIPVVRSPEGFRGVEAVIDKDLTAALLAETIEADLFVIVTDIENACIFYGEPKQQKLEQVTAAELSHYASAGHFSQGSMGPKVEAALTYTRKTKKPALICALSKLQEALEGHSGTRVLP